MRWLYASSGKKLHRATLAVDVRVNAILGQVGSKFTTGPQRASGSIKRANVSQTNNDL